MKFSKEGCGKICQKPHIDCHTSKFPSWHRQQGSCILWGYSPQRNWNRVKNWKFWHVIMLLAKFWMFVVPVFNSLGVTSPLGCWILVACVKMEVLRYDKVGVLTNFSTITITKTAGNLRILRLETWKFVYSPVLSKHMREKKLRMIQEKKTPVDIVHYIMNIY